jgi:hypothetical protein
MMSRSFSRNRIRGVSFHHSRSVSSGRQRNPREQTHAFNTAWNGPSLAALRNSAPPPFTDADVHRLLADQGRQEIHTRVSDAVEHLGQLRQLAQSLQRFLPSTEAESRSSLQWGDDEDDEHQLHPLGELTVEVTRLQHLWKLHLDMLEMVVMAQNSLRRFPSARAKRTPLQVEVSSQRKK